MIGRLLWPVNLVSFLLLSLLCVMMVVRIQTALDSAIQSKAEGMATFLQTIGQSYVSNYDLGTLDSFSKVVAADSDFDYVVYIDKDGKAMTDGTKVNERSDITRVEKEIHDLQGKPIGRVILGYRRARINEAFWSTLSLSVAGLILTQLVLSIAIFLVSRGIVRPLHESLLQLSKTSNVLSGTSTEVSKFSEALSSGVNQQAEVVQQTTSAMSEMSSMLAQTSMYAKQSEAVMGAVTQKANNGMSVMYQMVEAVSSVQQANEQLQQMVEIIQEIGQKTQVINEIVFKTQLLSFNASIEAARAGQHGRGFAVVAEEVGNLAKMSGAAAQEISSLLLDSEKQVNEIVRNNYERVAVGKSVTEQALKNFKEIATDINAISTQVANISAAAREQELGVAQTNQAMSELHKTTDLNSQIAHRAQDTSGTLSTEIQALSMISKSIESSITGRTDYSPSSTRTPGSTPPTHSGQNPLEAGASSYESGQGRGNFAAQTSEQSDVADKIVEMAKRQRSDWNKNKKSS